MVGWFVQQQHVWFFQQQAADSHSATLTTGQIANLGIPCRQTQGISRTLQLVIQIVAIVRLNDGFQLALLFGQLVKVSLWVCVQRVHFIQTGQGVFHLSYRIFDSFAYGVLRIKFWLLRQVADFQPRLWTGFTFDLGINPGHNAQQSRFTGTVEAENTDFGTRKETQRDIFQDMSLRRNHFADAVH